MKIECEGLTLRLNMEYDFRSIEKHWQEVWNSNNSYKVDETPGKPKFYALDMFPYPSGAGLHVGHPVGYIASDIVARYKRHEGVNVLHPMGFDAFGLPAEQYAIQTGKPPARNLGDSGVRRCACRYCSCHGNRRRQTC